MVKNTAAILAWVCWSHRPRSSRSSHSIDKPLFIRWWPGLFVFTIWSATELKKKYLGEGSHLDPPNIYTMVTPLHRCTDDSCAVTLYSGPLFCVSSCPVNQDWTCFLRPKVYTFIMSDHNRMDRRVGNWHFRRLNLIQMKPNWLNYTQI